ncbi:NCS1 family nucleobase:cation symporter-1 [Nonomuraea thailandensis]|uniref:NCS1 family nucleobase:cation symporter-1 n=1 Tax=Nonomuraea thailandensis TaxID=1188745 RepID=A0A9X2K3E4_9ACTN|nr:cytosine permease [Nonomuraea thailandensis]MCP2358269.1 NCS1 family nucleobase:cation symporter-1 [Nonomuraea thailandensis]
MSTDTAPTLMERNTIGPIPAAERTGSARGVFGIWLGVNMLPLTVVTGALGTTLFHLPFAWALAAVVIGNIVGGVFMALHASQGPQLGVPQMIQARGQFGTKGAALIVLVATVMFMGFYISNLVVGAQSLIGVFPGLGTPAVIVGAAVLSMAGTVIGLRLIKAIITVSAVVIGVLVVVAFGWILVSGVPDGALSAGEFTVTGFVSMIAVGAVWQIAYAPYVSDYSRYLPAGSGARAAFWATYGGTVLSSVLVMALGCLVGAAATNEDVVGGLASLTGGLATVMLIAFALTSALGNAGNVYCATLNALTLIETFRSGWLPGLRGRLVTAAILHALGVVVALVSTEGFIASFTGFITILLYVLIPWSAINLVDYFVVRKGHYDVNAFFAADGGPYGRWNMPALVIYGIGLLVQIPFMVLPMFTGPVAAAVGGIDLAWLVGLAVSGGAYLLVARRAATRAAEPAVAAA